MVEDLKVQRVMVDIGDHGHSVSIGFASGLGWGYRRFCVSFAVDMPVETVISELRREADRIENWVALRNDPQWVRTAKMMAQQGTGLAAEGEPYDYLNDMDKAEMAERM